MSDPSAIQLPVNQALTSDMLLGLKPSAPKSRSYRISVAPLNKNIFQPGDQMIFELPTGRRGTWWQPRPHPAGSSSRSHRRSCGGPLLASKDIRQ